ncbi:GTPase ObgE [Thermodesulfobacteriota bacterium]
MGFLDEATITARSGDGGRGCVSFRRERFIPKGGPDGGEGGDGGGIILKASRRTHTLTYYSSQKNFKARNGGPGKGNNCSGKNGADRILEVPIGTEIFNADSGELLADIIDEKQEILLIPGGKGGKGNRHFTTSTNRAPRYAQPGLPGEEIKLRLSLKFLADIGLVGLPNSGKSTLLSKLSMANPKIGDYPFTTLVPNLGVMNIKGEKSIVIADIPGLIEGASKGAGLGLRFLKHIERTSLLFHLLDITYPAEPGKDILEDYYIVREEIEEFNPELGKKPHMVIINKIDLYNSKNRNPEDIKKSLKELGIKSFTISALKGQGLEKIKEIIGHWSNTA